MWSLQFTVYIRQKIIFGREFSTLLSGNGFFCIGFITLNLNFLNLNFLNLNFLEFEFSRLEFSRI